MEKWTFRTKLDLVLIGCIIFFAAHLALAKESNVLRTQGLINPGGSLKAGYLVINETIVYIDKRTQVMDHRETPISITEFQPKRWVYMEVEKDQNKKARVRAKKIYLLPHYINPEERKNFPFMN